MSGFSATWLSLREPADHRSRPTTLGNTLAAWAAQRTVQPLQVVDLGAGTGSNLRYLCPHLGLHQSWHLLDNDVELLACLPDTLSHWADNNGYHVQREESSVAIQGQGFSTNIRWSPCDLANANRFRETAASVVADADLVTASALLDLVSSTWVDALIESGVLKTKAALFALNYNGKVQWQPRLDDDTSVCEWLNQHQRGDKGFGAALGPIAGDYMAERLATIGLAVTSLDSDWIVEAAEAELQLSLAHGWVEAARELDSSHSAALAAWLVQRQRFIDAGNSTLRVGHRDILALPVGTP